MPAYPSFLNSKHLLAPFEAFWLQTAAEAHQKHVEKGLRSELTDLAPELCRGHNHLRNPRKLVTHLSSWVCLLLYLVRGDFGFFEESLRGDLVDQAVTVDLVGEAGADEVECDE